MKAMAKASKFASSYLVSSVSSVLILPKSNWTVKVKRNEVLPPAVTYSHIVKIKISTALYAYSIVTSALNFCWSLL